MKSSRKERNLNKITYQLRINGGKNIILFASNFSCYKEDKHFFREEIENAFFRFQKPIVLNVLGIYKQKMHIDSRNLNFIYPPNPFFNNTYEAFFEKLKDNNVPEEKITFLDICARQYDVSLKNLITVRMRFLNSPLKKKLNNSQVKKISEFSVNFFYFFNVLNHSSYFKLKVLNIFYKWESKTRGG